MAKQDCICKCLGCNKLFIPKKKDRTKYCSRECFFKNIASCSKLHKKLSKEIYALKRIHKAKAVSLLSFVVLKEMASLLRISRAKHKKYYESFKSGQKTHKLCDCCKKRFVYVVYNGRPPKYCNDCKDIAYEKVKRIGQRINKAKRRARIRGLPFESIDPLKIFERDKWICHICKKKTPKKLRGTFDDKAPELDHIVTLADGGSHTYSNVACSCRKCNQKKGSISLGQPFLL